MNLNSDSKQRFETMKACTYQQYGLPEVIEIKEVPDPTPGPGEIRVRVRAATVNRTDCARLTAKPFIMRFFCGLMRPRKTILGTDFAGEVESLGEGAVGFSIGQRVFGFYDEGLQSQAGFAIARKKDAVVEIPDGWEFPEAAALCEGAHYALYFLKKVDVQPGDGVLVNGATGAIGSALVQILNDRGARVTAVCAGEHMERVRALGAERVIDYEKEDFTQIQDRFDYVVDAVGKSTFRRCRRILKPKGVYTSSELGPYCQNIFYALITPLFRGRHVRFPIPGHARPSLETMQDLAKRGRFQPLIDRRYPLDQAADAYRYVLTGMKTGNVVLTMER